MRKLQLGSRGTLRLASLLVLSSVGIASPASAVVEQIDGRVMPLFDPATCPSNGSATGCVQVALNIGEGFPNAATNNPLQSVFDAQTTPEVFAIPQTGGVFGNVLVRNMVEGAGFENSFGWYNVDDPDNRFVITPCADEPGSQRTVNFQDEFTAGNYTGGFIGFFLITPEDNGAGNCGEAATPGYIYFTEAARNGDGNYVHYLIYTSKVDSRRFYFGFEDLFRGGDNDFEDMFLQVDGLVLPCVPSSEICNGEDDNCDGLIDNNPVDAGGDCGLTDAGVCELGVVECNEGELECVGEIGPVQEQCNGLDDDCDFVVDNDPAGDGDECGTDVGVCTYGSQTCVGGVFVCVGGTGPAAEVCDLLDNDCNSEVDDDPLDAGGPCGSNVGECEPGILVCNAVGEVECEGGVGRTDEVCNLLDDDCNGAVDDGNPGGGAECGTDVGVCDFGSEICVGGEIECVGGVGPSEEICDGVDNDCNGDGDALAACPNGSQCVEGTCAAPCGDGEFPCPGGQICLDGYCVEGSCDDVTCDEGEVCRGGICIPEDIGEGGAGPGVAASSAETTGESGTTSQNGSTGSGDGDGGNSGSPGDNYGLATGGSGLRCTTTAVGSTDRGASVAAALALLGMAVATRRSRRRRNADPRPGGTGEVGR